MPWGTYVHVPWCSRRCPYCGFHTERATDVPWEAWLAGLRAEHARWQPMFPGVPSTLYLGGGTPSLVPKDVLRRAVAALGQPDLDELTVEVNPEDAAPAWLEAAVGAGVDRVSLGVQTLDPRHARTLGRTRGTRAAPDALRRVRTLGLRSWSVDLIFAVPGQSLDDLRRDLDALLAWDPPHVATYGLTFEPGTAFTRLRDRGHLAELPDDAWRAMYDTITATLRGAGLERYEVSNFARPGHESRHNQLYWTDAPYLGLGPGAHGYAPDGTRWANPHDTARWLANPTDSAKIEVPTPEQAAIDALISALRGRDGVDLDRLARRTGRTPSPVLIDALVREGLLRRDGPRLALTDAGVPLADALTARLARGLVPAP